MRRGVEVVDDENANVVRDAPLERDFRAGIVGHVEIAGVVRERVDERQNLVAEERREAR